MRVIEVLKQCTIEGDIVKLPKGQLERKLYQEVAKSLQLIGGKWKGNKIMGFVFQEDPTELLAQIANGEKRNLKKEFQFFGTPALLADELVKLSGIHSGHNRHPNFRISEPSAGQGAIIKAIHRKIGETPIYAFELMDINRTFLEKIPYILLSKDKDFLQYDISLQFDIIIANPPFAKNQDIDHIYKMFECLKSGGRIVSIASKHWEYSANKKETEFRNWLNNLNAEVIPIKPGAFKESGTMVGGKIILINKS